MQNWFKAGDYNALCDSCGRKYKASTMKMRWDGLFVCSEDYEIRHPQLSLRVTGDKQTVPVSRPDVEADIFVSVCYMWDQSGYANLASAGCAKAGNNNNTYAMLLALKNGT